MSAARYLYGAYGMNTHKAGMAARCPAAKALGAAIIWDMRLVFRGVADIVEAPGREMAIALWSITEECERALDLLEGYQEGGGGLYRKIIMPVRVGEFAGREAMLYKMEGHADMLCMPPDEYVKVMERGYADFGLPQSQILRALAEAGNAETEWGMRG